MLQVCSVYSQLLQLFSRAQFARAVKHHGAERNAKGFSSWEQFVAMLFCQLAHLNSLREVCMGLASCESPLKHLGIRVTPKKSTLAYANANRPWELYESIFMQLLEKCQTETAAHCRRKFRFKNKLMSLDASVIELSATMFDWAKYTQQKGAIKLHLLLDHDGYLPSFAVVTEGKYSELNVARDLRLKAGTILAVDRGYNDYVWFGELTRHGVFFVTRMKPQCSGMPTMWICFPSHVSVRTRLVTTAFAFTEPRFDHTRTHEPDWMFFSRARSSPISTKNSGCITAFTCECLVQKWKCSVRRYDVAA